MKALPTQFGDRSFSGAVATPTCSSCCCCCCCLASTVVGSIAVTQIAREKAQKRRLPQAEVRRISLLAAATLPVVILLTLVAAITIYPALERALPYTVNPIFLLLGGGVAILAAILAAVFRSGSNKSEVGLGIGVAILLTGAFIFEIFAGMYIIFGTDGAGGVLYLVLVAVAIFLAAGIVAKRNRRKGK